MKIGNERLLILVLYGRSVRNQPEPSVIHFLFYLFFFDIKIRTGFSEIIAKYIRVIPIFTCFSYKLFPSIHMF